MNLNELFIMAKAVDAGLGINKSEMIILLNKENHESLQKEIYYHNKKTLQDYKSENTYQVLLYNTRYSFKIAP